MILNFRSIARLVRSLARIAINAVVRARLGAKVMPPQPHVLKLSSLVGPGDEKFVVFFAPDAGVVAHFIGHCVVAKTLEERGYRTLIVRCLDVYPRCVVMDSQALPQDLSSEQRNAVCGVCNRFSSEMTGAYGLTVVDLSELVDDEVQRKVNELTRHLPEDLSKFEIDGNKLGQICGAEAAVTMKTTDFTGATPEVRRLLISYLKGSLLSYFAMQRMLNSGRVARVIHFNEYAILLSAGLAARKVGVPTTYMTMASVRGVDRRRLVFISDAMAIISYRNRLADWSRWRELRLPAKSVKELADDCLFRISGNSIMVYSPVRTGRTDEVFARLGLSPSRKLFVAFTSSLDEVAANNQYLDALGCPPFPEQQPFRDQIEWLEALIARVEASSDLQLIVRVHPREGVNRRESTVSAHLKKLKDCFFRPYKYVFFVWPGDDVSSYDLMELADVGLSAWSSTALEMARFGVPAVIAFDRHTPLPVGDVVTWAVSPAAYFQCLDDALARPPSLAQIRFAYRWTHLHLLGCAVDLGDVIPDANCSVLPPFSSPAAGAVVEEILVRGRSALEINRERLMATQDADCDRVELETLLHQLRRAAWVMCMGEERLDDYRLCWSGRSSQTVPRDYDAIITIDGGYVEFRTRDHFVRRRSRMVQRLAVLAGEHVDQMAIA